MWMFINKLGWIAVGQVFGLDWIDRNQWDIVVVGVNLCVVCCVMFSITVVDNCNKDLYTYIYIGNGYLFNGLEPRY